ncbi:MAG: Gfo/Idh/MocA family protein [Nitrospinales bacterium]
MRTIAENTSSHPPLNIGLIGCGRAAERYYLPVLHCMPYVRIAAVADPLLERARLISGAVSNCQPFTSTEKLLQKTELDAVIVVTPPNTHIGIITLSMDAGLPVLVEKPLAPTMAGIDVLQRLINSVGGSVMLGFNRRHWRPVLQLQKIISNETNDYISAQLVMVSNVRKWSSIETKSDPLEDLGSHQFDLLRFIFKREILTISARWTRPDALHMRIKLTGGAVAECRISFDSFSEEVLSFQTSKRKYRIHAGSDRTTPTNSIRPVLDLYDALIRKVRNRKISILTSYERQLRSFFDYVRSGIKPQPNLTDGIAAIRAVEAARKSAANDACEVTF